MKKLVAFFLWFTIQYLPAFSHSNIQAGRKLNVVDLVFSDKNFLCKQCLKDSFGSKSIEMMSKDWTCISKVEVDTFGSNILIILTRAFKLPDRRIVIFSYSFIKDFKGNQLTSDSFCRILLLNPFGDKQKGALENRCKFMEYAISLSGKIIAIENDLKVEPESTLATNENVKGKIRKGTTKKKVLFQSNSIVVEHQRDIDAILLNLSNRGK